MVSLEQVKLLESKVTRAIEIVNSVTLENRQLKEKLCSCQKQNEELEALIGNFKTDQNNIESGILSALDRLNKLEDVLENKLSNESPLPVENKLPSGSPLSAEGKLSSESPSSIKSQLLSGSPLPIESKSPSENENQKNTEKETFSPAENEVPQGNNSSAVELDIF